MTRYARYKPTGISWLPEVPDGWEVRRIGDVILSLRTGLNPRKFFELNATGAENFYVTIREIRGGKIVPSEATAKITDEALALCQRRSNIQVGDLLFSGTGTIGEIALVEEPPYNWGVKEGIYVLKPKASRAESRFLLYMLGARSFLDNARNRAIGTGVKSIPMAVLSSLQFPLPPLPEQQTIAAYLDLKCGKIDRLVAAKEKEVALLKELKQSMIAEAVTGRTSNRPMKPSGIPWLPEVPEGWKCRKMKYLFKERSDKGHPEEPPLCSTQAYGVIPQSLYENRVVETSKEGLALQKLVKVGDFVISLRAFQGGIEIAHHRGIISAAYTILEPCDVGYSPYFRWLFKSQPFIELLKTCVTGIREGQNINYPLLSRKFIPLPPLPEQREIVAHIESKCGKIDALVEKLAGEVAALKEYRERLVADVVTGQRKVA